MAIANPVKKAPYLAAALALGAMSAWLVAERRHPLRRRVEPQAPRVLRNLALALITGIVTRGIEAPLLAPLTALIEQRRWGLLQRMNLPGWLKSVLGLAFMDYTLYWWHVQLHRVPWLWRCHVVHHADLDLDASTALRFHFLEFLASIPWRAAQVALGGISAKSLSLWQKAASASVLFHHSNVRLPIGFERGLSRFITTPRLHGIHHSVVRREHDSNFSSGLMAWDYLHGTARLNVPQAAITIGVPAWRKPRDVTLPKLLAMPFRRQRATSAGNREGTRPVLAPCRLPP